MPLRKNGVKGRDLSSGPMWTWNDRVVISSKLRGVSKNPVGSMYEKPYLLLSLYLKRFVSCFLEPLGEETYWYLGKKGWSRKARGLGQYRFCLTRPLGGCVGY